MHGWADLEIPVVLFALVVTVVVSLAFAHQVTSRTDQRLRSLRFRDAAVVSAEAENEFEVDQKSMLDTNICAVCQKPATRLRCSRCKSTKYCSSACQLVHWEEGHKKECRVPESSSLGSEGSESGVMCNGKHLETSKSPDFTTVLSPISLRIIKNAGTKVTSGGRKSSSNQLTKTSHNAHAESRSLPRPKTLLFSYDYFVKLFEWDALGEPCGLLNCGNSCFANVVLQCLTYTRPLTAYLLNGSHEKDCRRNDWCFMCELESHVHNVRQNLNPFSPIRILSHIRNIGNHLGYGRQEDAHEFMRFAIDSMQSICLDEYGGEKHVDPATQETSLIHHIFGGHLQSQVKCMQCHHESNRYESMMDLAVEIHGFVDSLEDALAKFTTVEMLDGDNKYKCDRCNGYVRARKQLTVYEAPNILTITLKRFQSGKFGKLNKRVTFPEVLDMSPYMSGANDHPPRYNLYAVVVHVDMLNASFFGHYICYVKDSNGVWYKIDDRKVKEVDLVKVLAQRAYMLFYSRSGARKAPTIEEHSSATLATSHPVLKKTRTSVCMETKRTSIFPPTLGEIPVPADFSGDELNESKLIQLKQFEENTGEHVRKDVIAADDKSGKGTVNERGKKDLAPVTTAVSEEKEPAESRSSVALGPSFEFISNAPNVASTFEALNSSFSANNNLEQCSPSSGTTDDDLYEEKSKPIHQQSSPWSSSKSLVIDQLEVFPCVDDDQSSPRSQVINLGGITPSISAWASGSDDLFPSKAPCSHSIYSVLSSLHGTFDGNEGRSIDEADIWRDDVSDRIKRQHIEESSDELGSAAAHFNRDSRYMDIDEGITSAANDVLNPLPSRTLSNDGAECSPESSDPCRTSGNGELFRSSAALLEFESLNSPNAPHLTSSVKIQGAGIKPTRSTWPSGKSSSFLTNLRSHKFSEEFPSPAADIRKVTPTVRVTRSGIEIHEEPYDAGPIDDDIPYVIAKPLCVEPALPQFCEAQCDLLPDKPRCLTKASTVEMQDSVLETADGVNFSADTINIGDVGANQGKIDMLISDVKRTNQASKSLFRPGFLIKRPKSSTMNTMNCKDAVADKRSEAVRQGLFTEVCQDPSSGIPVSAPVTDGTEMDTEGSIMNGKVISNGNCRDEKQISRTKPEDSGRENSPIVKVQPESMKHKIFKQGRNDSCACGSQRKWKKCCGKASALKGLVTKQVTVDDAMASKLDAISTKDPAVHFFQALTDTTWTCLLHSM